MKKSLNNPHDKFFKSFILDKQNAIDFLKTFLPRYLSEALDFDSISIENVTFISESLSEVFSDAVFKCKIKENDIYISILIEHKSYPDKFLAVQLLKYLSNAYSLQLKNENKLELVVPLVYYHGKDNWKYKPISKIIEGIPDFLKDYVPDFDTVFVNLNKMSESELNNINNLLLVSALYMQKYSVEPELLKAKIVDIISFLENTLSGNKGNFIRNVFVYFNELVEIDLDELKNIINALPLKEKKEIMTTYQLIKQEGIKEGIKKGFEKSITRLFQKGFDIEQIADIMEISPNKIKEILRKNNLISQV